MYKEIIWYLHIQERGPKKLMSKHAPCYVQLAQCTQIPMSVEFSRQEHWSGYRSFSRGSS